jgi:hypothetical protein
MLLNFGLLLCGQLAYSLVLNYAGPNGSRWAGRTTHSWSSNPGCCGPGTYIQHPCQVAKFKWTTGSDKRTNLAIYDKSGTGAPLVTIDGLWHIPIYIPFPNTTTWHNGPPGSIGSIFRFFDQDIATVTNGSRIVGHLVDNFDFDTSYFSPAFWDKIGGSVGSTLPGTWFPMAGVFTAPTTFRIQYWET